MKDTATKQETNGETAPGSHTITAGAGGWWVTGPVFLDRETGIWHSSEAGARLEVAVLDRLHAARVKAEARAKEAEKSASHFAGLYGAACGEKDQSRARADAAERKLREVSDERQSEANRACIAGTRADAAEERVRELEAELGKEEASAKGVRRREAKLLDDHAELWIRFHALEASLATVTAERDEARGKVRRLDLALDIALDPMDPAPPSGEAEAEEEERATCLECERLIEADSSFYYDGLLLILCESCCSDEQRKDAEADRAARAAADPPSPAAPEERSDRMSDEDRRWIAAAGALAGVIAHPSSAVREKPALCRDALKFADALLAERSREGGGA